MRSHLGRLLADILNAKVKKRPLKDTISHLIYCCHIEKEHEEDNLLNIFNKIHLQITFTLEEE